MQATYSVTNVKQPFSPPLHSTDYQKVDSRVDLRALKLAQTYDNACNIFLRGAAESFLSILDEMGIQPRRKKFKYIKIVKP